MMSDNHQQPAYNPYPIPVPPPPASPSPVVSAGQFDTEEPKRRRVSTHSIILGAGALILVCIATTAAFLLLYRPISRADVLSASQTADTMRNHLDQAETAYNTLISNPATNQSALIAQAGAINTSLDSAQKELSVLKNSPVLRDSNANKKFTATQRKFNSYVSYIKQNTSDDKALLPVLTQMESNLQNLFSTPAPTDAKDLSAYLQRLTGIINTTSINLQSLDLQSSDSKQIVKTSNAYLRNLSSAVTKLQEDTSANNAVASLNDLSDIETANNTFNTSIRTLDEQMQDEQKQLDPQSSLSEFIAALDQLAVTTH